MLRPGQRLCSQVCAAEYIVVKPPSDEVDLTAGGRELVELGEQRTAAEPDPNLMGGSPLGKRYVDEPTGLEILVTKPGEASLAIGGKALPLKDSNPLPSTD